MSRSFDTHSLLLCSLYSSSYGGLIPSEPVENPAQEQWRAALQMARIWTKTVNEHGGDVTLVHHLFSP